MAKKILDLINSPADLKKLNMDELNRLCAEIRETLVDVVSKNGGHLASNLGVVELTVAMHAVFDIPKDKIIFDVGHQSYVHKLLTGRRDKFDTLRKFGGISGFPKRSESEYDCFDTGHSSTSISAALGIARARDLAHEDYNVVALFGDGALTGGMMYEAMNDAGHSKTPLILVLNDNAMSISKNVGAIAKHLRTLRISPVYVKSKHAVEDFLSKIPVGGNEASRIIKSAKRSVRRMISPTTFFDELGFNYIGPVDGHNLQELILVFERAKTERKPVVIHALTKKGKGYAPAENNPSKFHGISAFDKETGKAPSGGETYSDRFGKTLVRLAEQNDKIIAITGAMPIGTGLGEFAAKYKKRFFDIGIAEQHGVTLAAGFAAAGYIPVIPLYSSFLQRAYDQTLHDVCLQNLHVVFPIDRAGIVGADGETHQGVYDISYLSHMPNMSLLSPCTLDELEEMLDYAINKHDGPIAIRYPRGSVQSENMTEHFIFGNSVQLSDGGDLSIIATGRMVKRAQEAAELLEKSGVSCGITSMPTIKPLDKAAAVRAAMRSGHVAVIEDNVKTGGLGQMIAELLLEKDLNCKFRHFAFPDVPIPHGSIDELDKLYGLDAESIYTEVIKWLK